MSNKNDLLNTLIARAEQSERDKLKIRKIHTECLGEVILKIPSIEKVGEWMDETSEKGEDMTSYDAFVSNADIVFQAIPFLKDNFNQLSEAYEEKDPAVLTLKIFDASGCINELGEIADIIVASLGLGKETVKNL